MWVMWRQRKRFGRWRPRCAGLHHSKLIPWRRSVGKTVACLPGSRWAWHSACESAHFTLLYCTPCPYPAAARPCLQCGTAAHTRGCGAAGARSAGVGGSARRACCAALRRTACAALPLPQPGGVGQVGEGPTWWGCGVRPQAGQAQHSIVLHAGCGVQMQSRPT